MGARASTTATATRRREPGSGNGLVWLTVFGLAFGYLEGAVVVYLRALYYPEGFDFPLKAFDPDVYRVEFAREAATLFMLLGAACLSARDRMRRFGAFALLFGLWDLAYYVTLKLTLDWPAGGFEDVLLTWDVLFLIPVVWIGPVVAPCLVSVALVVCGALVYREPEGRDWSFLRTRDWVKLIGGGLVIIASFMVNDMPPAGENAEHTYRWWMLGVGLVAVIVFAQRWRTRPPA